MPDLRQITPFLHVPDLPRALDFLTRVLRFEIKFRAANYAYLEWESVAVRVLEERGRAPAAPGEARMTIYLDVRDVDGLYAELRPGLDGLPPGDVMPPFDEPWDQRELHVRLPDGHWLAFGEPVRSAQAQ